MGFSLGSIAQALLLCLNAMAILSERRLLSKYGLATPAVMDHLRGSGEGGTVGGDGGFVPLAFGPGDEFLRVHQSSPFKMQLASVLTSVCLSMSAVHHELPKVGPKLHTRWGTHTKNRKEKIQIWSAVALQQHFARGALVGSTLPTLEEVPPPLPGGRLSLAQKMGLVPRPPPAPSDEEWTRIEGTALRRNHVMPLGANLCCICQEPFYATMEQGQVLLSCSHVFHEQCFHQFEKFARRLRGKVDATPLQCPVCRNSHYHKRVFYRGKAMAERAAIVKIQAFFRRVLARKAYIKLRIESDSSFCGKYAHERLARLSNGYAAYADRCQKEQSRILDSINLRIQRARAECTTREDWHAIRGRVEAAANGTLDCPICLSVIESNPQSDNTQRVTTGEDFVAELRREYEARLAKKDFATEKVKGTKRKQNEGIKKKINPTIPEERSRTRHTRQVPVVSPTNSTTLQPSPPGKSPTTTCEKPVGCHGELGAMASCEPRYGVLLSCGHCFHEVCLSIFEHYTEMMALQGKENPLIPCCPMCRSAYVKTDY